MSARSASPFGARRGALIAFAGIALFLLTLWAAGSSMDAPPPSTTVVREGGRGFDGFAALTQYLEKRGYTMAPLETQAMADQAGLLVLTPPHNANLKQMEQLITRHRAKGPVLVIMPKWQSSGQLQTVPDGPYKGQQVEQLDAKVPQWPGWHDELTLDLYPLPSKSSTGRWDGLSEGGTLPQVDDVQSGEGRGLVPLVSDDETGRVLAGYLDDGGDYPALRDAAGIDRSRVEDFGAGPAFPLVLVFEPDLLNNWGFAKPDGARLAESMTRILIQRGEKRVIMDQMISMAMTHPREGASLIKLAFKPPFLAATICLILAAMVLFWRALHRFGPPLLATRAIAFGKRALVANAAGLIQRARRLHLLGGPYADAARERLARTLALPARLDPDATELAIDRALLVRSPTAEPFSLVAARLRSARRPADLVAAARQLHALERTLMR